MINERSIINLFIVLGGAILGPYLVISALKNDFELPMTFGAVCFILAIFFVFKDKTAALPLISVYFAGQLHFLPGDLGLMDIFSVALVLYYGIAYIALRQSPIHWGLRAISLPIFILALIVLYHDHSFGLHSMNNSEEGSRPGIAILLMVLAYFCGISIAKLPVPFLQRIPWYCCLTAVISAAPFILSTYIPSLAPYLFIFTTNVNAEAYMNTVSSTAGSDDMARMGSYAAIGGALQAILISQYPIYTWWRPERWIVAILSLVCFWLTVSAGYRNAVFGFAIVTITGAWCYYSWRAILLPAAFILIGYLFIGMQMSHLGSSFLPQLPLTVQRSLSFLPGDWNQEVMDNANSSNEFRHNIQKVYLDEYLDKSPLFGNGFVINVEEVTDINILAQTSETEDRYYQAKGFIVSKAFHVGWISLYDCVGLVGSIAFVALGFNMMWMVGRNIVLERRRPSELFGLKVWMLCSLTSSFFGFFAVFGDFKSALPVMCAYAIILTHMLTMSKETAVVDDDEWARNP